MSALPLDAARSRSHDVVVRVPVSALVLGVGVVLASCGAGEPAAPGGAAPSAAGLPAGGSVPTWYRDVEPIVQTGCVGCHVANGAGGFLLDRETSVLLATFLADRVASRTMPPWPPSTAGPAIADARALDDAAIATITAWAAGGAPLGDARDHVERPAQASRLPARAPDLRLAVAPADAYRRPASAFVSDEVRCFVLASHGAPGSPPAPGSPQRSGRPRIPSESIRSPASPSTGTPRAPPTSVSVRTDDRASSVGGASVTFRTERRSARTAPAPPPACPPAAPCSSASTTRPRISGT